MDTPIAHDSLCLGHLPARHARYRPHHTAVVVPPRRPGDHEVRLTWRELDAYVNRWANALASLGVGRGDRVATVLGNGLQLLATYWSCAKLGAAIVPMSPLLTASGLVSLLDDAQPKAVLAAHDVQIDFAQVRRALPDAPRRGCWRTPRRTTRPRASARSASSSATPPRDAPAVAVAAGGSAHPHVHVGHHRPAQGHPAHALHPRDVRDDHGQRVAHGARIGGAAFRRHRVQRRDGHDVSRRSCAAPPTSCTARSTPRRSSRRWKRSGSRTPCSCPSQIIAILEAPGFDPARLTSLQMVLSLGAPLHKEHKERLNRLLPDRFYELYGLTEGFITVLDRDDAQRKAGSVGVPPPFYDMRIVAADGRDLPAGEVGEIVGRGPITMAGLLRAARADRAGARRRLAAYRRPGLRRRGRLPLSGRPHQGHDRQRRRQGLPPGHGGSGGAAPGRARGRGVRHPARQVGRDAGGGRRAARAGQHRRRRAQGMDQRARAGEVPARRPRA